MTDDQKDVYGYDHLSQDGQDTSLDTESKNDGAQFEFRNVAQDTQH